MERRVWVNPNKRFTKNLQKLAPNLVSFLDNTNYFEKVTDGYYQLPLGITHNDLEVGITNFKRGTDFFNGRN